MENTNLVLSEEETKLVDDASVILTKNRIIEKVYFMFGQLAENGREKWRDLPEEFLNTTPKISRGENQNGLPWVMLDYPRYFTKTDVLAIRVFFWWGNFFSITLHVEGICKQKFTDQLIHNLPEFIAKSWNIGMKDDPWDHTYADNQYISMTSIDIKDLQQIFRNKNMLRVSKKYDLRNWDEVLSAIKKDMHFLQSVMSNQTIIEK